MLIEESLIGKNESKFDNELTGEKSRATVLK